MPTPKPTIPPPAVPKHNNIFDAWNSSSTGHQRAENRIGGSTGWRQSRTEKLASQFRSGAAGGKRISDKVGAGSEDWDEKANALVPKDVRARANYSIGDMLVSKPLNLPTTKDERLITERKQEDKMTEQEKENPDRKRGIFDGLCIFINGSTAPLVSDHKLKHILAENGAKLSIHLGRRAVSHVILGRPGIQGSGAGGGLAASKIQKELKRVGGCGVKYVGVEWVLESLKAGKRVAETPYSNLKIATKSQKSVYSFFKQTSSTGSEDSGCETKSPFSDMKH